jgi:hydrogenase nickel incorporation protein HypA/HybF
VALARLGDACPRCGSYQLQVTAGDEMRVKEIEID